MQVKVKGMLENQEKVKDFVQFQIHRNITSLFKDFLIALEDLNLPPEIYQKQRKRILDRGNESLREMDKIIEQLDIVLK